MKPERESHKAEIKGPWEANLQQLLSPQHDAKWEKMMHLGEIGRLINITCSFHLSIHSSSSHRITCQLWNIWRPKGSKINLSGKSKDLCLVDTFRVGTRLPFAQWMLCIGTHHLQIVPLPFSQMNQGFWNKGMKKLLCVLRDTRKR